MSRTPIAALTESQASATRDPAVIRLQRATALAPDAGGERAAVSFVLLAGGAHVLTGAAGSGKTALLEMIGLARPPAHGGLELFGQDARAVRPGERHTLRRRIGMIFQDLRLIDDLSARDNVALAARAAGRAAATYEKEVGELLAWVGLARRAEAMAGGLDEEGRRRLAVARALINRPYLVIADEPAGKNGQPILRLLADLNQAGTAILMATRDGALAANAGSEVTHLGRPQPSGLAAGAPGGTA